MHDSRASSAVRYDNSPVPIRAGGVVAEGFQRSSRVDAPPGRPTDTPSANETVAARIPSNERVLLTWLSLVHGRGIAVHVIASLLIGIVIRVILSLAGFHPPAPERITSHSARSVL